MRSFNLHKKLAIVLAVFTAFIYSSSLRAQGISCSGPYDIENASRCKVELKYFISCGGGSTICSAIGPVTIAPGTTYNVPASAFSCPPGCTPCEITVILYNIDGVNLGTPLIVDMSNPGPVCVACPTNCSPTGQICMSWSPTLTQITN